MEGVFKFFMAQPNLWAPMLVVLIGVLSRKTYAHGGLPAVAEKMLAWFHLLCVGYIGLWGGVMHVLFGGFAAHAIGWATSPFQYEVGIANFAFAVMGVYAFLVKLRQVYVAVLLGFSVWFIGDGLGHIYQLLALHNTAAYNAGATLYTDMLLPVMGWVFVILAKLLTK